MPFEPLPRWDGHLHYWMQHALVNATEDRLRTLDLHWKDLADRIGITHRHMRNMLTGSSSGTWVTWGLIALNLDIETADIKAVYPDHAQREYMARQLRETRWSD